MNISVIVPATDPLTSNFQVFFSCVASWAALADEVVVVDGGTSDATYDVLRDYAADVVRVSDGGTMWPVGRGFHGLQITVNLNAALLATTGDWVIVAFADYVAVVCDRDRLRRALEPHSAADVVAFQRSKVDIATGVRRDDWRGIAINRRLIDRPDGTPVVRFGASTRMGTAADWPVRCRKRSSYVHPQSGAFLDVYYGPEVATGLQPEAAEGLPRVDAEGLRCCVFDHFFYTPRQVAAQALQFYEYYASRHLGIATMNEAEVAQIKQLDTIAGFVPLEAVQSCSQLPAAFRADVERWWRPNAYGAARRGRRRLSAAGLQFGSRLSRKARTRIVRGLGYPSVHREHEWGEVDSPLGEPLVVSETWARQDRVLAAAPAFVRGFSSARAAQLIS